MKIPILTRARLAELELEPLHVARNNTKADVYRFEWPPASGRYAVLKDMKPRPAWFRLTGGRVFLRREYRALKALEGIAGVPRALARPDADAIVMEWHSGTPAMNSENGAMSEAALENVARIIAAAHARGITHGDLHRSNVLLAEDGGVTLIDWATAGVFGLRRRGSKAFTFAEWCAIDLRAVAKFKARHAPHCLSPHEKDLLLNGSKIYRLVRTAGFKIRKMLGHTRAKPPERAVSRYQRVIERLEAEERADGPS